MPNFTDFMAALGGFGAGGAQGMAEQRQQNQQIQMPFFLQQARQAFEQEQQQRTQTFQAGQQERTLGQQRELQTVPTSALGGLISPEEAATLPARINAPTATMLGGRVMPVQPFGGIVRVTPQGVQDVVKPPSIQEMFGTSGEQGNDLPPGMIQERREGVYRGFPMKELSTRRLPENEVIFRDQLNQVAKEHPDWRPDQISAEAATRATGIRAPIKEELSGAGAAGSTAAKLETENKYLDIIKNITGGKTAATTGARISTEAQNFFAQSALKGQRVFDTKSGKDVTTQVINGSFAGDPNGLVNIPKEKGADLQMALARRDSYVKVSQQIEDQLGAADDLVKRGQISAQEWARRTTGSGVLSKQIAALNDHALTSMRILTGGAPRSEQMLEVSMKAFGDIKPGTSKEVIAQARQNFLTQMDEQIQGLQYGLQAPPAARPGGQPAPQGGAQANVAPEGTRIQLKDGTFQVKRSGQWTPE